MGVNPEVGQNVKVRDMGWSTAAAVIGKWDVPAGGARSHPTSRLLPAL